MQCPHCGHEQSSIVECEQCGVIFSKWKPHEAPPPREEGLPSPLEAIFGDSNVLRLLESPKGLLAAITDWPVAREFDIVDSVGRQRGSAAQEAAVMNAARRFAVFSYPAQQLAFTLYRKFGFFSEAIVQGARGEPLGVVKQRFSLLRRRYDLLDGAGQLFATINGSLLKRWSFAILDRAGQQCSEISKPYAGYTEEVVTEARRFKVDFMNHHWTLPQRAVILAAAVNIDFDVFEGREHRVGLAALGD